MVLQDADEGVPIAPLEQAGHRALGQGREGGIGGGEHRKRPLAGDGFGKSGRLQRCDEGLKATARHRDGGDRLRCRGNAREGQAQRQRGREAGRGSEAGEADQGEVSEGGTRRRDGDEGGSRRGGTRPHASAATPVLEVAAFAAYPLGIRR
jgi:hypothetical protein